MPDHISLWQLRLAICQPLQQFANVRPTKVFKGTQSPLRNCADGQLDWVIIRENSEGEYAGHGGISHKGMPWETATEVSIFTRHGVERIMKFAFETAQKRPKKHITVVTKSNAQRNGMVMWDSIAAEVAKDFPDVTVDKMLVDAMTTRMVLKPGKALSSEHLQTPFHESSHTFLHHTYHPTFSRLTKSFPETLDTIVATNLVSHEPLLLFSRLALTILQHADILSDLAAALAGSIGIAPTSNLDPTRENPSMFEPIHGSAFDITGMGIGEFQFSQAHRKRKDLGANRL